MQDESVPMKIAIWQGAGHGGDVASNLGEVGVRTKVAAAAGAHLVVFPECFLTGYVNDDVAAVCRLVSADVISTLAGFSDEYGTAIVVGSYEQAEEGIANSAFTFLPGMGRFKTYRKRALFGEWEESKFIRGSAPAVFDLEGVRIGVLICFDVEFPGLVRELAVMGCDLVVVPTALMSPYHNVARILVPARAMENQVFVAYANRVGRDALNEYIGLSTVVDPDGSELGRLDSASEDFLIAPIDTAVVSKSRADFSYLAEEAKLSN